MLEILQQGGIHHVPLISAATRDSDTFWTPIHRLQAFTVCAAASAAPDTNACSAACWICADRHMQWAQGPDAAAVIKATDMTSDQTRRFLQVIRPIRFHILHVLTRPCVRKIVGAFIPATLQVPPQSICG